MPQCNLCEKESGLQSSHIIPRFIYKYMLGITNNSLSQFDGHKNLWQQSNRQLKKKLFCSDCEQLLGRNEKLFSTIFKDINTSSCKNQFAYAQFDLKTIKQLELNGYRKEEINSVLKGNPLHGKVPTLKYFAISYVYRELLNNSYKIAENEISLLKGFLLSESEFEFLLHIRLHDAEPSFNMFSTVIVLDGLEDWKHFVFYLPNMQFHVAFCVNGTPPDLAKTLILPTNFFDDDLSSIKLIKSIQLNSRIAGNLKT